MRGRPDVDLRLPPVVHPGEDLHVEVVATSHSDTPIDFFDLALDGTESLVLHVHNQLVRHERQIVSETSRLHDKGTLTEGEHRFSASFRLPIDASPSYVGVLATVRYEVRVHVSIPWWPDLRETYEVLVERHPEVRPKPNPTRVHSEGGQGLPFMEMSVADTSFAPGDEISGAFSAGNVARGALDGVEISLVAVERVQAKGRIFRAEQLRHNVPNLFKVPRGAREVPFRFRVPKEAMPSLETPVCTLEWTLQATLGLHTTRPIACMIPVNIRRFAGGRSGAARYPDVGVARWRSAWAAAGEPYGLAVPEDRLALAGRRGEVEIEVEMFEGEDEAALAALFRFPSIQLDLNVKPQLIVMLPSALELSYPGYKIEQRELAQAQAFLGGRLREALSAVKLVSAADDRIEVRAPVTGYDRDGVSAFLRLISAIADALIEAFDAIPPPLALAGALPAWRAFAEAHGARLIPGAMMLVHAMIDGCEIHIRTLLSSDGAVQGTRVILQLDPPLKLQGKLDVDTPASFAWTPAGTLELAEALRAQVKRLEIRRGDIALEIPGGVERPEALRPKMLEMMMLARRLRGERSPGPYR